MKTHEKIIKRWGLNNDQADVLLADFKELIVSAGAGSGKTKTLVSKIIYLLEKGLNLDELLVLTFTKKAAFEMKERIKKELLNSSKAHLVNKIASANIMTFDAYAYRFVKNNAALVGLNYDIELFDQAVFHFIKKNIMKELFLNLYLENDDKIINMLNTFTNKLSDDNFILDLIALYEKLIEKKPIANYLADELYIKEKLFDIDNLQEELNKFSREFCLLNIDYLNNIYQMMDEFNKIGAIKSTNNLKLKWTGIEKHEKRKIEKILTPYLELLRINLKGADLLDFYEDLNENLEAILMVLTKYDELLKKFKTQNSKYEFSDIATFLNEILTSNNDILERLKNSIKYIFVDEYQDTSDIQSNFLNLLIKDNEKIEVLYVGDIKQSIYKFRNANPKAFIDKLDSIDFKKLNTNYRSSPSIIKFVNQIFTKIFVSTNDHDFIYKKNHEMIAGKKDDKDDFSGVFVEEIFTPNSEKSKYDAVEEAFIVGNKIKSLIESKNIKKYSEIAIISRNKTNFKTFINVFEFLKIPLQVQIDERLKTSYMLKLIANILYFSLNIKNIDDNNLNKMRFCYFSIARSELFRRDDFQIFDNLVDYNNLGVIDDEILNHAKHINKCILTMTNYQIINSVIKTFKIYEKIIFAPKRKEKELQIDYLYDISKSLASIEITHDLFVGYIYDLAYDDNLDLKVSSLKEASENSVKLINIHQSKGLEYEVLFVVGLNKKFAGNKIKRLKYSQESKLSYQFDFSNYSEKYEKIVNLIKAKNNRIEIASNLKEELRLMYVAFTRAKRALFLVTTPKDNYSLLNSYADYLYNYDFLSMIEEKNIVKYDRYFKQANYYEFLTRKNLYYPKEIDNLALNKENEKEYEKEKDDNLDLNILIINDDFVKNNFLEGTLLHEKFEFNDDDNIYVKKFKKNNFAGKKLDEALFLYYEFDYIFQNQHGIIDLVVEYNDEIHIIDYKSLNINNSKYYEQLARYKNYIKNIFTNKPVKVFLYSIIKNELNLLEI